MSFFDALKAVGKGLLGEIPGASLVVGGLEAASAVAGAIGGDTGSKIQSGLDQAAEGLREAGQQPLTPEQQVGLKAAIMEHRERMAELGVERHALEVKDAQGGRELARAEILSDDEYVRRTRPGLLRMYGKAAVWLVFLIVLVGFGAVFVADVGQAEGEFLIELCKWALASILATFVMMFKVYTGARSRDKEVAAGMRPESVMDKLARLKGGPAGNVSPAAALLDEYPILRGRHKGEG